MWNVIGYNIISQISIIHAHSHHKLHKFKWFYNFFHSLFTTKTHEDFEAQMVLLQDMGQLYKLGYLGFSFIPQKLSKWEPHQKQND